MFCDTDRLTNFWLSFMNFGKILKDSQEIYRKFFKNLII